MKKYITKIAKPTSGSANKRRGGGVQGYATKENKKIFKFVKIKYIFFKTTYPNINISVNPFKLCCPPANSKSLTGFLKYLPKNTALLGQKLEIEKKAKIRFWLF